MVSYAAGTRFLSLIGGVCLSFYDWYADLPPASPQIWGDQTDVPESADWWNAGYVIIWGSNIPQTRTPDAHFMTEARYRGQKVVVVSPDYAGHTKFADHWLPGAARLRRRARDGDGPRDPQGVLRRAAGAVLPALRAREHRPAVPRHARASATASPSPAASCAPPISASRARTPTGRRSSSTSATGRAVGAARLDRLPLGRGGDGQVEPRARRASSPALTLLGVHDELVEVDAAALRRRRLGGRRLACAAASPRSGSAACSSRPSSTCSPRSSASAATGCPATGRPATTTRSRTRRRGRRSTPASTRAASSASPASSHATPSARTAAR